MPQFLTQEWIDAIQAEMNADEKIRAFASWGYITLEHVATDVPGRGEVRHWRRFADGKVEVGLGQAESPSATLTTSYDDAVAINKGELDVQQAFTSGRLKVDGDVSTLLQYQAELAEVADTVHGVPAEY